MNREIEDVAKDVIKWYWQHGSKREGVHALGRGGWLDPVNRIIEKNRAIKSSLEEYAKPTMALWGPSQAGKSILLAEFIDSGADDAGNGSALSWDKDSPARFSGNLKKCEAVLNPYNKGADASGCVTRFQLAGKVRFEKYPIEIRFATEMEVLLSLAVGYLSETEAKDKEGKEVHFEREDLDECVTKATQGISAGPPNPKIYSLLTELLDVVDVLVDLEESRYANLKGVWESQRGAILNNDILASSEEAVIKLAAELLWDGWENMTKLYKRLHEKRAEFEDLFHHKSVFCSVDIAAIMLNINSAHQYIIDKGVRDIVDSCRVNRIVDSDGKEAMAITKELEGMRLFGDEVEFALAQGLVSLMVVKLRDDIMQKGNPDVYHLLQKADIVDFPGVANEHKGVDRLSDEKIDIEYTEKDGTRALNGLVKVMKRGKTASIVVSSSRNLNIDVFSLLVRMPAGTQYPAHPQQLMNGVSSWFKSMGRKLESGGKLPRNSGLQMNLILTFSATLINLVKESGMGSGLSEVFDKLQGMGDLADPKVVRPFCVTYPGFEEGKIRAEMDERKEIIEDIKKDKWFKKLFDGNAETIDHMAGSDEEYGGRSFLFKSMLRQLESSKRRELLEQQKLDLQRAWQEYMNEALPGDDLVAKRRTDIEIIVKTLKGKTCDEVQSTAQDILKFQNVDPSQLNSFPRRRKALDGKFIESQISQWIEAAKREPLQTRVGFVNSEHRSRILTYLRSRVDQESITELFDDIAVLLESRSGRSECRRLFATFMTSMLYPRQLQHRAVKESVDLLEGMVKGENSSDVSKLPYYVAVIAPFIETLEELEDKGADQRGEQEGDKELQALVG